MTHIMHTHGFAETNKTRMQVRVDTRYTGAKTAVKTNYKSGYLLEKEREGLPRTADYTPHHTKVANSSCLKRKERGYPRTAD